MLVKAPAHNDETSMKKVTFSWALFCSNVAKGLLCPIVRFRDAQQFCAKGQCKKRCSKVSSVGLMQHTIVIRQFHITPSR